MNQPEKHVTYLAAELRARGHKGNIIARTDGNKRIGRTGGNIFITTDARLLPPLVVHEKVWADASEFGVGFVPHLGFQDLGFIDERSVIA